MSQMHYVEMEFALPKTPSAAARRTWWRDGLAIRYKPILGNMAVLRKRASGQGWGYLLFDGERMMGELIPMAGDRDANDWEIVPLKP